MVAGALAPPQGQGIPAPAPTPASTPAPAPAAAPGGGINLQKVTLTEGSPRISLAKQGGTHGAMRVNLNWSLRGGGFAGSDLDLDLSCLWELTDGTKGIVHALGDFGGLNASPFVQLDKDDRSGAAQDGENLTINLDHSAKFRRLLIFANIYQGAPSFQGIDAVATLTPQSGGPIEVRMGDCTVPSPVCTLFMIRNVNGELVVQREANYIVPGPGTNRQPAVDYAYGWGLSWHAARKN
jgi:tellurite resistance protein TerA